MGVDLAQDEDICVFVSLKYPPSIPTMLRVKRKEYEEVWKKIFASEPDLWIKANPNIGKTISFEAYQLRLK